MKLRIYFQNDQEKHNVFYNLKMLIRRTILATLDYEGMENDVEVSVTFVDDEGIRELNNKFRKMDKPTDVLSFPLMDYEGESDEPYFDELAHNLGDIVISLERAMAQANEFGHSVRREIGYLTIHSMLHLLGYDHLDEGEQKKQMRKREEEIAASIPGMQRR